MENAPFASFRNKARLGMIIQCAGDGGRHGDKGTGRRGEVAARPLSIRGLAFYIVLACFAPEGFFADAYAA